MLGLGVGVTLAFIYIPLIVVGKPTGEAFGIADIMIANVKSKSEILHH